MSVWEAIILGIVQGITEFLPISSSGHLQIAKEVLGVTLADNLTFDIVLHLATVLATITVLWREIGTLIMDTLRGRAGYALKLVLSAVPVALVGLLLRDQLNAMLASPNILLIVGGMLVLTAGLLWFAGRKRETGGDRAARRIERETPRRKEAEGISFRDAFIMGLAQAAAAMPGLSRSGSTIATGLILGNQRAAIAQFSFLMVIIPIVGEVGLDALQGNLGAITATDALPLVAGFAAAFAVGVAACRFMIEMVKRSKLVWFAAYCGVVGAATIIYYFC